jgi:WD40 repeat protein
MKNLIIFSFVFLFVLIQSGLGQDDTLWTRKFSWAKHPTNVKFSPDGQYIAVGMITDTSDTNGAVQLRETLTGDVVWKQIADTVLDLLVTPDSNYVITAHTGKKINIWRFDSGQLIHSFTHEFFDTLDYGTITSMCISNNSRYLYLLIYYDIGQHHDYTKLYEIDLQTDSIVIAREQGYDRLIRYCPTSDKIAIAGVDIDGSTMWLLNSQTLSDSVFKFLNQMYITDMKFSPNGNYLATSDQYGYVKIWSVPQLDSVIAFRFDSTYYTIYEINFSHNSNYLLIEGDNSGDAKTKVWDLNNREYIRTYQYYGIFDISPNDSNIIFTGNKWQLTLISANWTQMGINDNTHHDSPQVIRPNPTNGKINLELNVKNRGQYSIKIINEKGNEIQQIGYNTFDVGKHEINWDAGKLPAGVYFIVVRGKNYSETYKFIKQ